MEYINYEKLWTNNHNLMENQGKIEFIYKIIKSISV